MLQPRFVPGLTMTVDYIDIDLTKPISSLSVAQIASGCFDNETFDANDPANGNSFCSQIRRDATGQVIADPANPGVSSGFVNGQRIYFAGVQGTLDYTRRVDGLGPNARFSVDGNLFYVHRRIVDTTGVAPARSDGIVGDPQFQGQLNFRYADDNFGIATFFNYIGEQLISRFNRAPAPNDIREFDEYDDYVTVDASVFFNINPNFRLTLGVTNLFDRIGQEYYGYYIPGAISDNLGRRYSATARVKF